MDNKYEGHEMEIIFFQSNDVVAVTSGGTGVKSVRDEVSDK